MSPLCLDQLCCVPVKVCVHVCVLFACVCMCVYVSCFHLSLLCGYSFFVFRVLIACGCGTPCHSSPDLSVDTVETSLLIPKTNRFLEDTVLYYNQLYESLLFFEEDRGLNDRRPLISHVVSERRVCVVCGVFTHSLTHSKIHSLTLTLTFIPSLSYTHIHTLYPLYCTLYRTQHTSSLALTHTITLSLLLSLHL
jgi:hypothetical protein